MGTSFLVVILVVFGGFISLLGLLALAVTKTVNPDGQATRGCLGGCAAVLALFFLTGLGALGLGTFVLASAVGTAVEKNPIERIEIRRGTPQPGDTVEPGYETAEEGPIEHFERDDKVGPVHLLFTMRGNAGKELVDFVKEVVLIDDHDVDLDDFVTVHTRTTFDGDEYQIVEFQLPFGEKDLNELEDEIRRELDGLEIELPESVVVEFEGAKRFY